MIEALDKKPINLIENIVLAEEGIFENEKCLSVRFNPKEVDRYELDGPNFAYFPIDFHNGTIEVDLVGSLEENAPKEARGFVGLAYRIKEDLSQFEILYVRPTNGRADDQIRRNHSTQYCSYPTYTFAKLRQEEPEKYESYCDMQPNVWMHIKIEVEGEKARLYVNNSEQPVLIVNDMKLGADAKGGVGLWIDNGTLAYFKNLKIEMK